MSRELINQVRELLDRNLDVVDISARLNVDLDTVKMVMDIIKELVT